MYKIVSAISVFTRTFIFPNPFTRLFEVYLANTIFATMVTVCADLFNLFIGGTILFAICFPLVGIIYDRGEAPVIGSLLYMEAVLLNSWLLILISNTLKDPNLTSFLIRFVIVLVIEIGIFIGIRYLKRSIYS